MALKINYVKTSELIPYANNSRTHTEKQVQQVASSIKEFGFTNPILVDEQQGIIAGHGRVQAAELLNMDKVPTITLKGLTEAQKKAYVIADNQLAMNAGWDMDKLKLEIETLNELDFDVDLLGFDNTFMDTMFGEEPENEYSQKVGVPTYEPSGDKPDVKELYDDSRTFELIENIKNSKLPQAEKDFLMLAAGRHTVLDFEKIANYYAHSNEEAQKLMEDNALVIIDYDQAIEKGYVQVSDKISEQYTEDYPDE